MRLLFSSIHCYLDPSSGAALCTRELLELLAARGMDCRVLTTGILDPERETTLDEVLATLELPCQRFRAEMASGRTAEVIDLTVNGVRVTVMPTASSRAERRVCGQPGVDAQGAAARDCRRLVPDLEPGGYSFPNSPFCDSPHLRSSAKSADKNLRVISTRYRLAPTSGSMKLEIPGARSVQLADTAGPMFVRR